MFVVGAAVIALVVCITGFALDEVGIGLSAAIVGLMALGVGLDWLAMDGRRIRQAEREWFGRHRAR
jgi:membrane associated rhomboid family serine protease